MALSSGLLPNLFKWRALGYKMALPQRVLGSNHRNRWKIFKNFLLQNHLPLMLEIRYVALSSGPLPSLFKSRSEDPTWPYARGSWVWNIEIHSQMKNNLQFQNYLAQMLEIWYRGLHSWALLSLLKWWPQVPKSSAALGFGFEPLNSGERFRVIMALLYEISCFTGHFFTKCMGKKNVLDQRLITTYGAMNLKTSGHNHLWSLAAWSRQCIHEINFKEASGRFFLSFPGFSRMIREVSYVWQWLAFMCLQNWSKY